jgi:hypothetical protein
VGPRAVLDTVVKRKIVSPRRESNPRTPIVQPAVQRYTDFNSKYYVRRVCVLHIFPLVMYTYLPQQMIFNEVL